MLHPETPKLNRGLNLARKTTALFFSFALLSTIAFAEGTRTWEQSKFDDLVKGTPKGIALRSNGGMELAPAFKTLATLPLEGSPQAMLASSPW